MQQGRQNWKRTVSPQDNFTLDFEYDISPSDNFPSVQKSFIFFIKVTMTVPHFALADSTMQDTFLTRPECQNSLEAICISNRTVTQFIRILLKVRKPEQPDRQTYVLNLFI